MNGATRTLVGALSLGLALTLSACQSGSTDPAAAGNGSDSASSTAGASASDGSAAPSGSESGAASGSSTPGASESGSAAPSAGASGEVDAPEVKATGDAAKTVPKTLPPTYRKAHAEESKAITSFLDGAATSGEPSKKSQGDQKRAAKEAESEFDDNAAGTALKELQSEYVNNAVNGRTVTGKPVIKGTPRTVDLKDGKSRIFVCLDSSAVEVKVGKAVENPASAPGTRTAVHVYDMLKKGDRYVVERHSFTNDPSC
ncbi:hypothetical protein [Galactobacter caseinivorans]|uniref:Lipoprotein n=1 Tax=Galactobacter caseinivorans TaxID=2676123 RepID=A0A496PJJ7_9MICC|nr:hypothetical protein [Galactobacter caseinivorans]RKW70656.1 hypothetical protein DWQ67_05955 [Galactobacter caseinivorans]